MGAHHPGGPAGARNRAQKLAKKRYKIMGRSPINMASHHRLQPHHLRFPVDLPLRDKGDPPHWWKNRWGRDVPMPRVRVGCRARRHGEVCGRRHHHGDQDSQKGQNPAFKSTTAACTPDLGLQRRQRRNSRENWRCHIDRVSGQAETGHKSVEAPAARPSEYSKAASHLDSPRPENNHKLQVRRNHKIAIPHRIFR